MFTSIIRQTCLRAIACAIILIGAPSALAQDDSEPNDTPAQAVELSLPYTWTSGTISTPFDVDFYKFSAVAGQQVTAWLESVSTGSPLVPILSFYDSTGKLLAYNDGEWNLSYNKFSPDPILYLKMPSTGIYYLAVSSAARFRKQPPGSGSLGPYSLILFTRFDSSIVEDQYEPNDTRQTATPISLPFVSVGANLLYLGDIDWYTFNAHKGDRISIDIDALELESQPGFSVAVAARLGLFNSSGQLLFSADNGTDPDTGYSGDPCLTFEVPQDGNYYIAVTAQSDTQFVTLFKDPTFLQDPYVDRLQNRIGFYRLQVRTLSQLYFPQIANGAFSNSSFSTSIVLLNRSSRQATGNVSFFRSDGTPFQVSFGANVGATDKRWFSIAPLGALLIKTDGSGSGASGYAIVTSTASLGGSAIFSQYDSQGALVTEAGVGSSSPMDFFVLPVDLTGSLNAGLAVANILGASSANLSLNLINSKGQCIASRELLLDPGTQVSAFVGGADQLFPGVTDFQGSLQVLADTPVSVVALRSTPNSLTTLTPAALDLSFDSVNLTFPHIVVGSAGASYRSTIVLTNPGCFPVTGTVQFTRSDGNPMVVSIGPSRSFQHSFAIPAQGTVFLETSSSGNLETGYATVTANHGVGGTLVFSQYNASNGRLQSEVAIPPAQFYMDFMVFAQNDGLYSTAIAFANTNADASELQYLLRSYADPTSATPLGPVPLDPNRQQAVLVSGSNQLFPAFSGLGTLEVTSSQPIPAVALRITATTMTALPIIPLP
jgi:hypothetical protein